MLDLNRLSDRELNSHITQACSRLGYGNGLTQETERKVSDELNKLLSERQYRRRRDMATA